MPERGTFFKLAVYILLYQRVTKSAAKLASFELTEPERLKAREKHRDYRKFYCFG